MVNTRQGKQGLRTLVHALYSAINLSVLRRSFYTYSILVLKYNYRSLQQAYGVHMQSLDMYA